MLGVAPRAALSSRRPTGQPPYLEVTQDMPFKVELGQSISPPLQCPWKLSAYSQIYTLLPTGFKGLGPAEMHTAEPLRCQGSWSRFTPLRFRKLDPLYAIINGTKRTEVRTWNSCLSCGKLCAVSGSSQPNDLAERGLPDQVCQWLLKEFGRTSLVRET